MNLNPTAERFLTEWALDEFTVGHYLGVQTFTYGPDLEENIAVGSIAQDEMGHARMLLSFLADSEKAVDRIIYGRTPEEMRVATLAQAWRNEDWPYIVVKQFLYDSADQVRFGFFEQLPDEQLKSIQGMMGREERVHREHWLEWIKVLASDAKGRARLQKALDELYPYLADFFATDVYEEVARGYGIAPAGQPALLTRCLQRVMETLQPHGLNIPMTEEKMIGLLGRPGGRAGRHLPVFGEVCANLHKVYDLYPDMVWG